MSYLLDTDTCSSVIRNVRRVSGRFAQNAGKVHVSVVSITELELWLLRVSTPVRYTQGFFAAMQTVTLIDVTEALAHRAAMIGSALRHQGLRSGLAEILMAATALEKGLTLVTHATQPFTGIPGLMLADWSAP